MVDKNMFFAELDNMKPLDVGHKLEQCAFRKKDIPLVQEWLRKEYGRDYKTTVRHQLKQPDGKVVMLSEAAYLYYHGWVDTPAKFGKGLRGKWYNLVLRYRRSKETTKKFFIRKSDDIITAIVIFLIVSFLTYLGSLFYPYLTKNTSQSAQQPAPVTTTTQKGP